MQGNSKGKNVLNHFKLEVTSLNAPLLLLSLSKKKISSSGVVEKLDMLFLYMQGVSDMKSNQKWEAPPVARTRTNGNKILEH